MTFLNVFAIAGLFTLSLMLILWLVSLFLKNSSIVDVFWGTGFVILTWIYFFMTPDGFIIRKFILAILTSVWGLRLSGYILWRNWGKPEDFRYHKWRKESGKRWWWKSFFQIFLLQGLLMWIISTPLLAAQTRLFPDRLTSLDFFGTLLWVIGFFFETSGDLQLAGFRADPANRGKVMQGGVWQYTRRWRMVDRFQPNPDDHPTDASLRCQIIGKDSGNPTWLQGICRKDKFFHSLVSTQETITYLEERKNNENRKGHFPARPASHDWYPDLCIQQGKLHG
jgi:hypothetical protein